MTNGKAVGSHGAGPRAEALARRVRELAAESRNIDFAHPHIREQLAKRSLTMRQVLEAMREGEPRLDGCGDWRVKLAKVCAGRKVQVVVAVHGDRLTVVTAI